MPRAALARRAPTRLALTPGVMARALDARDPRFDGLFFVGITTTGIYCRPVCPARVSDPSRRRFFPSAAAAERAGFRPCLRCRPELAPGHASAPTSGTSVTGAPVDALPRLARWAEGRIAAGALNGRTVAALARDLGVSARHLRRACEQELGVSPLGLAQTHRLLLAKRLLADTTLSVTQVAYASGFQSLRRFNATFRDRYRLRPSDVRRPLVAGGRPADRDGADAVGDGGLVRLTLTYRPPLAWRTLLGVLARDAVPGVEAVTGRRYRRTLALDGRHGIIAVEHAVNPAASTRRMRPRDGGSPRDAWPLQVAISPALVGVLMPLLARLRRLFDLDADPVAVDAHLASGGLTDLVGHRPGLRLPGAVDGFDVALRLLLRGRGWDGARKGDPLDPARDLAGCVVRALGAPVQTGDPALTHLMPDAARVADAGASALATLGVPRRRADAAIALARAVADGRLRLEPGEDPVETQAVLADATGVPGGLAAAVVARALAWADAFAADDRVLQRAAGLANARALRRRARHWRPWRAYAALHLRLHAGAEAGDAPPVACVARTCLTSSA